jgi:sulfur-carrier protein
MTNAGSARAPGRIRRYALPMATVVLTRHLHAFFPALAGEEIRVDAATVADLLQAIEHLAPGFAFYLCDEAGRLRPHVNIFVDGERISDRARLSDPLGAESEVLIMQALSGG